MPRSDSASENLGKFGHGARNREIVGPPHATTERQKEKKREGERKKSKYARERTSRFICIRHGRCTSHSGAFRERELSLALEKFFPLSLSERAAAAWSITLSESPTVLIGVELMSASLFLIEAKFRRSDRLEQHRGTSIRWFRRTY